MTSALLYPYFWHDIAPILHLLGYSQGTLEGLFSSGLYQATLLARFRRFYKKWC